MSVCSLKRQKKTTVSLALFFLGCLLLCFGGCARLSGRSIEGLEMLPEIKGFAIEGNTRFTDQEIFDRIKTGLPPRLSLRPKPHFDPVLFEVDLERIEALYRANGYFDAKVLAHEVSPIGKNGKAVSINVVLREGEPVYVRSVQFEGLEALPTTVKNEITKNLPLEVAENQSGIFVHSNYLNQRSLLLSRLLALGYAQATVQGSVKVDTLARKADVLFQVQPGLVSRFGMVRFEGLARVRARDVQEYLRFSEGEPFRVDALVETKKALYETGNFSAVDIEPDVASANTETQAAVNIIIRVEEASEHLLQLGGGAGIDANGRSETHLRAQWLDRSFLGGMRKLQISGSIGTALLEASFAPLADATLLVSQPAFLAPKQSLSLALGALLDAPSESLTTLTVQPRLSIERDLSARLKGLSLGYGYALQLVQLCFRPGVDGAFCAESGTLDDEALQQLGLNGNAKAFRLGYIEQHGTLNRTDNPINPSRGYVLTASLHEGAGPLAFTLDPAKSFTYLRAFQEARLYLPVYKNITAASRLQLGLLFTLGQTQNSPFPERFFLGGASSHRGFGSQELSPTQQFSADGNAVPIGGDGSFLFSNELRLDVPGLPSLLGLPGDLRFVAFADVGNVTSLAEELFSSTLADLSVLRTAVGGGLRYVYGPLIFRVDVAHLYDFEERDAAENKVSISIGEAF